LQVIFENFSQKKTSLLFNPIKNHISSYLKEKRNNFQETQCKSIGFSPKVVKNNSTNDLTISSKEKKEEIKDKTHKSSYKKNKDETIKFIQFQLIENEYIAKIDFLTKENLLIKTEKLKLEEKVEQLNGLITSKENEIVKMRTNVVKYDIILG
jgi:hypothetical protein